MTFVVQNQQESEPLCFPFSRFRVQYNNYQNNDPTNHQKFSKNLSKIHCLIDFRRCYFCDYGGTTPSLWDFGLALTAQGSPGGASIARIGGYNQRCFSRDLTRRGSKARRIIILISYWGAAAPLPENLLFTLSSPIIGAMTHERAGGGRKQRRNYMN